MHEDDELTNDFDTEESGGDTLGISDAYNPSLLNADEVTEFAPAMTLIDWSKYNFYGDVTKRIKKGPSMESFSQEVASWQAYIHALPPYDEQALRQEIYEWDFEIPTQYEFNFDSLVITYARLVAYRNRITHIYDMVFRHYKVLEESCDSLRKIAIKLSTGPKHDKEANAAYTIQPLLQVFSQISAFKAFLEQVIKSIDFASLQIDRLMKERQSLSKINQGYVGEGQSQAYMQQQAADSGSEGASSYAPPVRQKPYIKTRNSRL